MKKNWKTTIAGLITGLLFIIKGIIEKNPAEVVAGVGIVVTGAFAADAKPEEK